mmetsp:Transcript_39530/g.38006  ORF Transcript_39530/g.38006 Transcript_39530/m.38006 type:complete len:323 (+) Transcript_39530:1879-2847(+)
MVSLTVNYLHSLISNIQLSKRNYTNAKHCCISLAEYVQGPCFVNQNLIKEANFYQLAVQILQMKPILRQDLASRGRRDKFKNSKSNNTPTMSVVLKMPKKSVREGPGTNMGEFNMFDGNNEGSTKHKQEGEFSISNFMIQKLKLMCTIILLSLLEQRTATDPLLLSMKRSIPIEVIKQNIVYEYYLFCKDYKRFLSRENFFRHVLSQSDTEVKEELIIEVGFNLFFLLKRWSEDKKTNDSQLEEMMSIVDDSNLELNAFAGTFKEFFEFLEQFSESVKTTVKNFRKMVKFQGAEKKGFNKRSEVQKFVTEPTSITDALLFFT